MGTYTANKELYMPTVGEQGWGTLMNGNLETIDNFLKPITVSGSTYTFTGNHVGNQSGGSISATSITNSGTLTNTGKITGNGGIGTTSLTTSSTITSTGKITGNGGIGTTSLTTSSTITSTGLITANGGVQGFLFVKGTVGTSGDENYATLVAISGTSGATFTMSNYSISYPTTKKHATGVYTRRAYDLSGTINPSVATRVLTVKTSATYVSCSIQYYDANGVKQKGSMYGSTEKQFTVKTGTSVTISNADTGSMSYSVPAGTTYKVKYATP